MRFDAQTQGWILLVLMLLMISLPVLISLHLKRRARGAKYAATLVSSGIRGEEDAPRAAQPAAGRVHLYPNRSSTRGIAANAIWWRCAAAGQRSSR